MDDFFDWDILVLLGIIFVFGFTWYLEAKARNHLAKTKKEDEDQAA